MEGGLFVGILTGVVVRIDVSVDRNYYPVEEARRSNMRHRPIGLGAKV